ncbi:type IV pilus twitching motility protein PilT [Frisingicoccus sp.]|uniref:type IV pilus twitching motility protein PilT n=1 Tax=Frisingicoccus sp. TaxID=1918627 RepID=UPI003AB79E5D
MYTMEDIILLARKAQASDIHISEGMPLLFRIHGVLTPAPIQPEAGETAEILYGLLSEAQKNSLLEGYDKDFALQTSDGGRQRVNIFRQKGKVAGTIRLLNDHIPTLEELMLPDKLYDLAAQPRGLVLVTGPTGSGKSTTLAAMVEYINRTRSAHIITIEDPIEYVYEGKKALIHQRETGSDVVSFAAALRSALREDPDIILVGEMRDYETISAALTAAETGHLVLSTLHTTGAAQTIDRIIDACPAEVQNQVRIQLAGVLKGIVTQCLLPRSDGRSRIVATELLLGTDAALNLMREGKTHQLGNVMHSGGVMHTLNMDLARLMQQGYITRQTAEEYTNDKRELMQY